MKMETIIFWIVSFGLLWAGFVGLHEMGSILVELLSRLGE